MKCSNFPMVAEWWAQIRQALLLHAPRLAEVDWDFEDIDDSFRLSLGDSKLMKISLEPRQTLSSGVRWNGFVNGGVAHLHDLDGGLSGTFARGVTIDVAVKCCLSHAYAELRAIRKGIAKIESKLPPRDSIDPVPASKPCEKEELTPSLQVTLVDDAPARGRNIAEKDRVFKVWARSHGVAGDEVTFTVGAGEDSNKICEGVMKDLIDNEFDTGWEEIEEDLDHD